MSIVHLIFWPRYVQKTLGVPVRTYIWDGWVKITLLSIPFAIATVFVEKHWLARSLPVFALQVLTTLPVYIVFAGMFFRNDALNLLRRWRMSRVGNAQTIL
jgi:hypothetical protein